MAAQNSRPVGDARLSVARAGPRLRGRYTESVEGGDAMSRDRADVAEHGSGEAVEPPQVP